MHQNPISNQKQTKYFKGILRTLGMCVDNFYSKSHGTNLSYACHRTNSVLLGRPALGGG
jgi:hypothetical protein